MICSPSEFDKLSKYLEGLYTDSFDRRRRPRVYRLVLCSVMMSHHRFWSVVAIRLAVSVTCLTSAVTAQQQPLTIDDIFDPDRAIDFDGNAPFRLTWLDNEHYLKRATDGSLLKVKAVTGERVLFYDVAGLEAAISELSGVTMEEAGQLARQPNHQWNADRTALVFDLANDLYHYCFEANQVSRLTQTPEREEEVSFSPNGLMIAFVRGNNLYVVDIAHQREYALTTDGSETLRNGLLNWIYQEEIYGRGSFSGYWWSPNSTRLVYLQLNDTTVPTYTVIDHIPYHPEVENWNYPKAGDSNPAVRLGIVRSTGGDTQWVETTHYVPNQPLIVNIGWSPDSQEVVFQVQNREQTWLDLNVADVDTGIVTRILRETTGAWVNVNGPPTWLEDGSFLWLSERSGWKHIYQYQLDGTLSQQITNGEWELRQLHGIDEANGWIYFSGTERSHIGSDVYRIRLDGSGLTRLSEVNGTHRAQFDPSFTRFIDTWSDIETPPQVRLHAADGTELRVIDENVVQALEDYRWSTPEFIQIPNRNGFRMEALLIKPPDFDPSRRYPVYEHVYAGPHAPLVRNGWLGRTRLFWQLLAEHDIIVWVLDNSTASGKGAVSTWPLYKNFGELELNDLEDGIAWLKQQPYVDPNRIGIEGWSYGGFIVSYALTHSQSWTMGIAGGSVTDWLDYDTIYTERYMLMPQNNPDGYKKSSPRFSAADLHGSLLLIHGTMDKNVHMQNTLQFAYELQKAGKLFEMMIYPRSRHRFGGQDLEKHRHLTMLDFVLKHLHATPAPSSAMR